MSTPAGPFRGRGEDPRTWSAPFGSRPSESRVVRLLGARRELIAWVLTLAALLDLAGRVVTEFAYPAAYGLRYNAITAGPGLGGVELLVLLLVAAALAVAADATPKSRLVVLVDLLVVVAAVAFTIVGLLLTLAAYGLRGIAGLVTGSVLVQLGNLAALVVGWVILRRALRATPRPLRQRPRPVPGPPAPAWPGPRQGYPPPPGYYAPPPYRPAPYGPAPSEPRPVGGTGRTPEVMPPRPF